MISFPVQSVSDEQCGLAPHSCRRAEELHILRTYHLSTTLEQPRIFPLILNKVKMSNTHPVFENVTLTTGSPARPDESDCPICDESMADQETLTHTNRTCNHSYHRACWEQWMTASAPATCPMDRERLCLRDMISSSATARDIAIYSAHLNAIDRETRLAGRTAAAPRDRLFDLLKEICEEHDLLLYVTRDAARNPVYLFVGEDEYVRRSIEDAEEGIRVAAGGLGDT